LQWKWMTAGTLQHALSGAGAVHPINGKLRDELLDREIFCSLREAEVLIERWRRHYNTVRPHSALGYRPPAPKTVLPHLTGFASAPLRHAQPGAPWRGAALS
ncbi:integrase core domain-containing protein, partial [Teichococcus wenyumeiae]|uniref:integrase core domain-containing protein n=1 Tax=Teichococcus wenyumeiae TaxID=2478470 RepID=UPI001F485D46